MDHEAVKSLVRPAPPQGAREGVKQDVLAAKEAGVGYNPRGMGAAWTHNFLNLKPWHPMSFRNREKVYKAEVAQYEVEKRNQEARDEYAAEQEHMKTLSMLSQEQQDQYRARQSVSFLYQKPPGFQEIQPAAQQEEAGPSGAPAKSAAPQDRNGSGKRGQGGGNYLARVVGGFKAAVEQTFVLKRSATCGHSPPRGGGDPAADNQRFVVADVDSDEEDAAFRLAMMPLAEKRRRRREARRQARRQQQQREEEAEQQAVAEAKAFLRAAGLAVPDSSDEEKSQDDGGDRSPQREGKSRHTRQRSVRSSTSRKRRRRRQADAPSDEKP